MRRDLRMFAGIGLAMTACFFAFFSIQSRSIWIDEANSIFTALRPLSEIAPALPQNDLSPPLYYFVLALWVRLFGISEVATRSLSGVFYLLSLGGIYLFTRGLCRDRRAGLLAAVLYMVSPLAARHAHSARMYSLLGLEVIFSLMFFYRLFFAGARPPRRSDALGYVIVNVMGTLTHQWFLFALAAQALAFLVFVFPARLRDALIVGVGSLLPYALLWLPASLRQVQSLALTWIPRPSWYGDFAGTFLDFFGGPRLGWVVFAAFALVMLAGRTRLTPPGPEATTRVVLSLFFVSVVSVGIPFLISLYQPIYVTGRYTIIALPPFVVGLSHVLWRYGRRSWLVACVGLLVVSSAVGLLARRLPDDQVSERKAAEYLMARAQPGDVLIYNGLSMLAFEYYLLRSQRRADLMTMTFPRELASHPSWIDVRSMLPRLREFADEAEGLAQELAKTVRPGRRVWVFAEGADAAITDLLTSRLEKQFRREAIHDFPGLTFQRIVAFRQSAPPPLAESPAVGRSPRDDVNQARW